MTVGSAVGVAVGSSVEAAVGASVGTAVGAAVGVAVGAAVGVAVGAAVGVAVGAAVGTAVGAAVGGAVGVSVATVLDSPSLPLFPVKPDSPFEAKTLMGTMDSISTTESKKEIVLVYPLLDCIFFPSISGKGGAEENASAPPLRLLTYGKSLG